MPLFFKIQQWKQFFLLKYSDGVKELFVNVFVRVLFELPQQCFIFCALTKELEPVLIAWKTVIDKAKLHFLIFFQSLKETAIRT